MILDGIDPRCQYSPNEPHRPPPHTRPPPAAEPPAVGFLAAVIKKFGDDQAGQLAALIAYYGVRLAVPAAARVRDRPRLRPGGRPRRAEADPRRRARAVPDHQRPAQIPFAHRQRRRPRDRRARLAARRHGRHQRHPERVQPNLERALQAPSQLPRTRACAASACSRSSARSSIVSTAAAGFVGSARHGAPAVVAGVLVAFGAQPRAVHDRLQTAHRRRCLAGASCCPA